MPRGRSRGAPAPPRAKRSSSTHIYEIVHTHHPVDYPTTYYQRIALCPEERVISLMGIKITALPDLSTASGGAGVTFGLGLLRISDMEEDGIENGLTSSPDHQRFRRIFARQTTFCKVAPRESTGAEYTGDFNVLIQSRPKGRVTLTSGHALYLATWVQGNTAGLRAFEGSIEYSQTQRMAGS